MFKPVDKNDIENLMKSMGTSYRGFDLVSTLSVKTLTRLFGKPTDNGDGYKCHYRWMFVNEKGEIATIYDYKGDRWHIGTHTPEVAEAFQKEICSTHGLLGKKVW